MSKDKKFRNRSLKRLWERDLRNYYNKINAGYIEDSLTGGWKYIGNYEIREIEESE